jgi:hypothetical protein
MCVEGSSGARGRSVRWGGCLVERGERRKMDRIDVAVDGYGTRMIYVNAESLLSRNDSFPTGDGGVCWSAVVTLQEAESAGQKLHELRVRQRDGLASGKGCRGATGTWYGLGLVFGAWQRDNAGEVAAARTRIYSSRLAGNATTPGPTSQGIIQEIT